MQKKVTDNIFDPNISLQRRPIFDPNKIPNCFTNWMCRRRLTEFIFLRTKFVELEET